MHNSEFAVDLQARTVTHRSGAWASFYEYERDEDWPLAQSILHNEVKFRGASVELAVRAKAAALAAGMGARRG